MCPRFDPPLCRASLADTTNDDTQAKRLTLLSKVACRLSAPSPNRERPNLFLRGAANHLLRATRADRAPTNPVQVLVSQLAAAALHLAWFVGRLPLVKLKALVLWRFSFSPPFLAGSRMAGGGPYANYHWISVQSV
jgi:hypothetical protein